MHFIWKSSCKVPKLEILNKENENIFKKKSLKKNFYFDLDNTSTQHNFNGF